MSSKMRSPGGHAEDVQPASWSSRFPRGFSAMDIGCLCFPGRGRWSHRPISANSHPTRGPDPGTTQGEGHGGRIEGAPHSSQQLPLGSCLEGPEDEGG
ncbi:hypothetical protein LIER_17893 [Lithospermum erythrorhizon]|uniref:Uncharacterized protein n=1 Tax=Lithospermum erythrorhizon TaxID=34254 RepID=A0AAV3QDA9_LITER